MPLFGFRFDKLKLRHCLRIINGEADLRKWGNDELSELGYNPYNFQGLGTPTEEEARERAINYVADCTEYLNTRLGELTDEGERIPESV